MRAADIKLRLEALSMSLNLQVIGLHSVRLLERRKLVDCMFDVVSVLSDEDESDEGLLHFRFPKPDFLDDNDIDAFALWLAAPMDELVTVH